MLCWDLTVLARPQQWKRWKDIEGPIKGAFASWGEIPYAKRGVIAGRGYSQPIAAQRDAGDWTEMPLERRKTDSASDIPNSERSIEACRNGPPAIRRYCDGTNLVGMPVERSQQSAGADIPNAKIVALAAIAIGGNRNSAIGGHGRIANPHAIPLWRMETLAGDNIPGGVLRDQSRAIAGRQQLMHDQSLRVPGETEFAHVVGGS